MSVRINLQVGYDKVILEIAKCKPDEVFIILDNFREGDPTCELGSLHQLILDDNIGNVMILQATTSYTSHTPAPKSIECIYLSDKVKPEFVIHNWYKVTNKFAYDGPNTVGPLLNSLGFKKEGSTYVRAN